MVDSIPSRAEWKTKELWYKSDPEDKHTIHYRDPLQAIASLLGNPAYASDVVYRPSKIFTDSSKSKRIYNEMWTGDWWNAVQVSSSRVLFLARHTSSLAIQLTVLC
jgi:hypothetical protein